MLRIKRQPLAARVAKELEEEIKRGTWKDILPSEHKLSAELGVSRTTLRNALSCLEKEGWLKIHQGSPTQILKANHDAEVSTKNSDQDDRNLVPLSSFRDAALHLLVD